MRRGTLISLVLLIGSVATSGCGSASPSTLTHPQVSREVALPGDIAKRGPETDTHPPILHSPEFESPVALPSPVNTSGAEDSPFIMPDGQTLYFFFTPDVRMPPEEQVLDNVSGVWVTHNVAGGWSAPERVWLQDPGKLSLDGAVSIQGDEMWFASAREGYVGVNIFTAHWSDGVWADWEYAGDRLMKEIQIGEVHPLGNRLYFHSERPGGKGNLDLWVTGREGSQWTDPINLAALNTPGLDGFPFVSTDGSEFWFTRTVDGTPAIFRSLNIGGKWAEPDMIVSQFAGEPSLDAAGNLYFVHHFFEDGEMIEADIYFAARK